MDRPPIVPDWAIRVARGHYARKQIHCRDHLIAWSHRRRFEVGVRLAAGFGARRTLDFGCGDGTFVALLAVAAARPAEIVGADLDPASVDDCRRRFAGLPALQFILDSDLDSPQHAGAYDALICMDVLEHVVDPESLLRRFVRLLAPGGHLLISVPVETGLPLLVKQAVRRIAGWRGLGDYPGQSPYSWVEMLAALFAGRRQHIVRPVLSGGADGRPFHDHKGFNWRVMLDIVARFFVVERIERSPIRRLPSQLATQVWFIATRPATGSGAEQR